MAGWQYWNPVEIHFGSGIIKNLSDFVGFGKSILITTPGMTKRGVSGFLKSLLGDSLAGIFDKVQSNPTFGSVEEASIHLRQFEFEQIIALGGGSTIDTAKAVACIRASGREDWINDHLKDGAPFPEHFHPKPIIAIPTTAGTGSEVTMWGTVWDMDIKKKYSVSHQSIYPRKAILDPELILTLPEKETIYSGLDAMSHAMESIWNKNHNPISDTFALKAISLVYDYLPELRDNLSNLDLRTNLLQASLLAGLAFSNTKTALAHSISYPLTAHFGLPHGLACALPLLPVLGFNGKHCHDRVNIMANSLRSEPSINSMKTSLKRFFEKLGVPLRLTDHGISEAEMGRITEEAITPERAGNNILDVTHKDIIELIHMMS